MIAHAHQGWLLSHWISVIRHQLDEAHSTAWRIPPKCSNWKGKKHAEGIIQWKHQNKNLKRINLMGKKRFNREDISMQVRICSPRRIFHKKPTGAAATVIVLAIYFGLLSIQRATNACWQAVWCGVIFNWEAGSLSPPFLKPRGGGWMGHRWPLAAVRVPLWACGFIQIRAAGEHAPGYGPYNYTNLWWVFTVSN